MGCARGVSGFGSNLGGSPREAAGSTGKRLVRRIRDDRHVRQVETRFLRYAIGLVVTANVEWRPEMNVADGDSGPLQASFGNTHPETEFGSVQNASSLLAGTRELIVSGRRRGASPCRSFRSDRCPGDKERATEGPDGKGS